MMQTNALTYERDPIKIYKKLIDEEGKPKKDAAKWLSKLKIRFEKEINGNENLLMHYKNICSIHIAEYHA